MYYNIVKMIHKITHNEKRNICIKNVGSITALSMNLCENLREGGKPWVFPPRQKVDENSEYDYAFGRKTNYKNKPKAHLDSTLGN